jgi:ubiquinone/menaquinone biosynthesis C-methylase UbiE
MTQPSGSPFSEAAPYYRFRAPYAPEAFAYIRDTFRLDRSSRVLDLGCGPGTVAIPLSRMVGEVVALDPSMEMIDEGRARAGEAGCENISWHCARAEELTEELGRFTLVTMGQSFHWMDRDLVLRKVAQVIAEDGGLVLINPARRRPQESWETLADEVVARYLGHRTRHQSMSAESKHEPALRRSAAFSQFTAREFATEFERDVASIIGCLYSMSSSPRSTFGERLAMFERELTEALWRMNPSGVFQERVETEVLVAPIMRPSR